MMICTVNRCYIMCSLVYSIEFQLLTLCLSVSFTHSEQSQECGGSFSDIWLMIISTSSCAKDLTETIEAFA